jgi:hypothetical protein
VASLGHMLRALLWVIGNPWEMTPNVTRDLIMTYLGDRPLTSEYCTTLEEPGDC